MEGNFKTKALGFDGMNVKQRRKNQLISKFALPNPWSEETIKFIYDYLKLYFNEWFETLELKLEFNSISKVSL